MLSSGLRSVWGEPFKSMEQRCINCLEFLNPLPKRCILVERGLLIPHSLPAIGAEVIACCKYAKDGKTVLNSEVKKSYYPGEALPDPGIYRVVHYAHRMPHLVTIPKIEFLPYCRVCEHRVCYEPMFPVTGFHPESQPRRWAPAIGEDFDLRDTPPQSLDAAATK